jgi:hypothetical protein
MPEALSMGRMMVMTTPTTRRASAMILYQSSSTQVVMSGTSGGRYGFSTSCSTNAKA